MATIDEKGTANLKEEIMRNIFNFVGLLLVVLPFTGTLIAQAKPEIITFSYDNVPLIYDEVEQGIATAEFSWEAVNVMDGYHMKMHALVGGQWVLIGENFEPAKSDTLVIAHPLSFDYPTYRLSIMDADGNIVDSALIYLDYADTDPDGTMEITDFASPQDGVGRNAVQQDGFTIPVNWQVRDRRVNTNLVFEQVISDEEWVPVELPRDENWVRSEGEGIVAPIYSPGAEAITLQLRVVEIITDETLSVARLSLPLVDDQLLSATVMPQPTVAPTPIVEQDIRALLPAQPYNAPGLVTLGTPMTLSWDVSAAGQYADEVVIREWHDIDFTGVYGDIPIRFEDPAAIPAQEWTGLPLTGEITVETPAQFPLSSVPHRDQQNVVIYSLYMRQDGTWLLEDEQYLVFDRLVYLQTVDDATACTPSIDVPEQVTAGENFTISWDLCGAPSVRIDYPRNDVVVWGLHPRFTPGNPGSHDFSVSFVSEIMAYDVTFTVSDPLTGDSISGTVHVVADAG
jgi:hypothetical protein